MLGQTARTVERIVTPVQLPDVPASTPHWAKVRASLRILRRSEKATLVSLPSGRRTIWIPRSVASANATVGLVDTFCLPMSWFAKVQQALEPEHHRAAPAGVQLFYSTATGPLCRENGKTQPIELDVIEQNYGQAILDRVMESAGHWVDVAGEPRLAPVPTQVRKFDPALWGALPG